MRKRSIILIVILIALGIIFWKRYPQKELAEVTNNNGVPAVVGEPEQNLITNGPMLAIADGTWMWEKTVMSDGKVTTPKKADAFSVTFGKDGRLTGTTDCNSFFANFTLSGSSIAVGDLGATKKACLDSQEGEFWGMLENADGFLFDDQENLVLTLKMDSGSVLFKKK